MCFLSAETSAPQILIADDQRDVLEALRLLLKGEGYAIESAVSPAGIISAVEEYDFDVVLMDLNYTRDTTSGREGLDLLNRLRLLDSTLPVIVMTAWGSVESAVEAMRNGARDYIEKPWDNNRLLATLRTQIELSSALRKSRRLEEENRYLRSKGIPELIVESRAMRDVLDLVQKIAPSNANVLITGEHGTGKEVLARRLHAISGRAENPLVTVNAGAIPEGLIESEFFGHVKGAFTDAKIDRVGCFELAHGGTLFLDEISDIPISQQAKLLRVLESGEIQRVGTSRTREVDVRVLSATNADPARAVEEGTFREDLLYRLNTVEIHILPLRERRDDIPVLAAHFLKELGDHYEKKLGGYTADAMESLLSHSWPGNVRELKHAVERAVLMARTDLIEVDDLSLHPAPGSIPSLETMQLHEAEEVLIKKALARTGGNVSRAAESLGLSRSALYRRLQRFGI